MDNVDPAQVAARNHFLELESAGLEVFAISRHELDSISTARVHHVPGLGNTGGKRFFAEHMLACLGRPYRIFFVLSWWGCNIDSLDLRVFQARGVLAVGIGPAGFEILPELLGLCFIAADHRD